MPPNAADSWRARREDGLMLSPGDTVQITAGRMEGFVRYEVDALVIWANW